MSRGLVGGFLWGSVVSVVALGTASLLGAPPVSGTAAVPQDQMEVPAGSGFTGERSEGATRLPAPDRPTAPETAPLPVAGGAVQAPPIADTAPAAQPQVAAEIAAPAPQAQPGAEVLPAAPAAEAPGLAGAAPQPPLAEAV
jgi:hypothetical protein